MDTRELPMKIEGYIQALNSLRNNVINFNSIHNNEQILADFNNIIEKFKQIDQVAKSDKTTLDGFYVKSLAERMALKDGIRESEPSYFTRDYVSTLLEKFNNVEKMKRRFKDLKAGLAAPGEEQVGGKV